jgi:hypothetical protein
MNFIEIFELNHNQCKLCNVKSKSLNVQYRTSDTSEFGVSLVEKSVEQAPISDIHSAKSNCIDFVDNSSIMEYDYKSGNFNDSILSNTIVCSILLQ